MEKKGINFNGHSIRRIIIAVFCICIGTCVAIVMFNIYNPNKNALGALASVSMDVICIIILLILIVSFAFDSYGSKRTTRLFSALLLATIWAMFLDFMNWALDGTLEFDRITLWFTIGSLCMGAILACILSLYLYSYMEETHGLSVMRGKAIACASMNMISFCISFILAISGTAFQFVDGHYETGVLYDVVTVIPVISLLYLTGYLIYHVKKIGIHDTVAVVGYVFFMIAGALIEAEYSIGTTYVAVAIADIFIFVTLQNEIIAVEKQKVQKWMKRSNTDELTGLLNRYAYEAEIRNLEDKKLDDDFIYVSADVNSLKATNDSLGHNAGDELLIGAANCLKECFGKYGKLYRTGGDEFIALIHTSADQLVALQSEIDKRAAEWDGELVHSLTISCGYVTRDESEDLSIREMATLADRRMYEAKSDYYRRTGIERRRR